VPTSLLRHVASPATNTAIRTQECQHKSTTVSRLSCSCCFKRDSNPSRARMDSCTRRPTYTTRERTYQINPLYGHHTLSSWSLFDTTQCALSRRSSKPPPSSFFSSSWRSLWLGDRLRGRGTGGEPGFWGDLELGLALLFASLLPSFAAALFRVRDFFLPVVWSLSSLID